MTQCDRDRLVVLRKAFKGLITQRQAAGELRLTDRQVFIQHLKLIGPTLETARMEQSALF